MNPGRCCHLLVALVIGAFIGLPVQIKADDTEIYLGNVDVTTSVRPNVLVVLDTSGSMSNMDGMSQDRLDRMNDALETILDDANNINVGLMRFTDPGRAHPVSRVLHRRGHLGRSGGRRQRR